MTVLFLLRHPHAKHGDPVIDEKKYRLLSMISLAWIPVLAYEDDVIVFKACDSISS